MRITSPNLIAATIARYAKSATFRLRYAYGEPPVFNVDDVPAEKLDELRYKPIRFATTWESCSPLMDKTYEYFVAHCIEGGRRWLAYRLMHDTFYNIKCIQLARLRKRKSKPDSEEEEEEIITNPMEIFHRGLENCKPIVITKKVKRGGAIYQVPYPLSAKQSEWFAVKWLIKAVKERPKPREKQFEEVMARELIDAAYGRGKVVKKKDDVHRLGAANKAYAHYRWG